MSDNVLLRLLLLSITMFAISVATIIVLTSIVAMALMIITTDPVLVISYILLLLCLLKLLS